MGLFLVEVEFILKGEIKMVCVKRKFLVINFLLIRKTFVDVTKLANYPSYKFF